MNAVTLVYPVRVVEVYEIGGVEKLLCARRRRIDRVEEDVADSLLGFFS